MHIETDTCIADERLKVKDSIESASSQIYVGFSKIIATCNASQFIFWGNSVLFSSPLSKLLYFLIITFD